MRALDLSDVKEAGTGNGGLPAGGYICKYTNVEDIADKEYLYMEYDIASGEHANYYQKLNFDHGFWGGKCYRSYKEKALPMFKRMCMAVSKSNPGYIFDGGQQNSDEKTLVGKYVGLVFGEEEYEKNNGDIGTRLYVAYECDIEKIKKGDFKVPEKKTLNKPAVNDEFTKIPDGVTQEIPF